MKTRFLGPDQTAYRALTPRWAYQPISGAGAGQYGGRANRIGVDALYLSLDPSTALTEYQQTSSLLPPSTLVTYSITCGPIVDFSDGYSADEWESIWEDFGCDWRELWFNQHITPPSWDIGDIVIAAGNKGILFPSTSHLGGTNLVLYPRTFVPSSDRIIVHDPDGALPKNPDSWR